MLICKEELRRIKIMSKNRERTFELLGMDVKELEGEDLDKGLQPDHRSERSASDKIQDALKRAKRQTEAFELLLDDVGMSLTSVRHLAFPQGSAAKRS